MEKFRNLTDVRLEINNLGNEESRQLYSEALVDFLNNRKSILDEDTLRKLTENPLRILDSKSETIQSCCKKPLNRRFCR